MTRRVSIDEDAMDQALVQALRARSADVITALDAGMIARLDEHHLAYATAQGGVLDSVNVGDFYRVPTAFLAQGQSPAGSPQTASGLPERASLALDKRIPASLRSPPARCGPGSAPTGRCAPPVVGSERAKHAPSAPAPAPHSGRRAWRRRGGSAGGRHD